MIREWRLKDAFLNVAYRLPRYKRRLHIQWYAHPEPEHITDYRKAHRWRDEPLLIKIPAKPEMGPIVVTFFISVYRIRGHIRIRVTGRDHSIGHESCWYAIDKQVRDIRDVRGIRGVRACC